MKCVQLFLIIIFLLWITMADGKEFNFTRSMIHKCKQYLSNKGYKYDTFYNVETIDQRKLKTEPDVLFEMHLAILAASNGHILLSSVAYPSGNDPVYEIVVGGGANKFSELRRKLRKNAKASGSTPGILSESEFRAFYIKITDDGNIQFGREGDVFPLLEYMDPDPIPIKYFSFASWHNVEAKFLYDCPVPGKNGSDASPDSQTVTRMSPSDELKFTLMKGRTPYLPPDPEVDVSIDVKVANVRYDPFETELTTSVAIVTKWLDPGLAWNPDKFNNITSLKFRQGQIWKPNFSVYNAKGMEYLDSRTLDPISVVNSGEATYHFKTTIISRCYEEKETYSRWPHDNYNCYVVLQPWSAHEKITLQQIDINNITNIYSEDDPVRNEWDWDVKQNVVKLINWTDMDNIGDENHSDRYLLSIDLRRQTTAYDIVFYIPLYVLTAFVLMSFWSEPLTMSRVWFYAGCTIVMCMGLCNVDYLIPCHSIPMILVLYIAVLAGVLLALLINVMLLSQTAESIAKGPTVQALFTAKWFRAAFFMPVMKTTRAYDIMNTMEEEEDTMVGNHSNCEEMQPELVTLTERAELADVVDKFMFTTYSVVFAVLFLAL